VEEAHSVSEKSLNILLPTIRMDAILAPTGGVIRHKSHFIFTYNRYMENDPIHKRAKRELTESRPRE
jgi:hypothetical protein